MSASAVIGAGANGSESGMILSVNAETATESRTSSLSRPNAGTSDDSNSRAMIYNSDVLNVGVESA